MSETVGQRIRMRMVLVGCKSVAELARLAALPEWRVRYLLDKEGAKWEISEIKRIAEVLDIPIGEVVV